MKTPGITVRPLRQMTGETEFNEVFCDNVRVSAENLVHRLNVGWAVATMLAYERRPGRPPPGCRSRHRRPRTPRRTLGRIERRR